MSKYKLSILSASSPVALEPRLLFDGAAAADVVDAFDEAGQDQQTQHDPNSQTEPGTSDSNGQGQHGTTTGIYVPQSMAQRLGLDGEPESIETAQQEKALIIIDARVENHELLINSLPENSQYIIIEEYEAGLELINQALEVGGGNYDSIHIISHGTPGSFSLGTDQLNNNTFNQHTEQLQSWSQYLNEGADILLYGCDIAQGDIGQSFITELAAITGADIAASTNATGNADQGGDWVLESETGPIEADVFEIEGYVGLLDGSEKPADITVKDTLGSKGVSIGEKEAKGNDNKVGEGFKITGSGPYSGSITVVGGELSSNGDNGKTINFENKTAAEIKDILDGLTYKYTDNSEVGYTDKLTITITDSNEGESTFTRNINITPKNDAPTMNGTKPDDGDYEKIKLEVDENGNASFKRHQDLQNGENSANLGVWQENLGLYDPDNSAEQIIIKITGLPTNGTLTLDGNAVAVGSILSLDQIDKLKYTHDGSQVLPSDPNSIKDYFKITVDDGAGGLITDQVVEIDLLPVNDDPSISGEITIIQGEGKVNLGTGGNLPVINGTRGELNGVDPDDKYDDVDDLTYEITSLPTVGKLYYNDVEITAAGTVISDLNKLEYEYPADLEPTDSSVNGKVTFDIKVTDKGGGAGESNAISKTETIEIIVLDNNNDPYFDGVDLEKLTNKDDALVIKNLDYTEATKVDGNTIVITEEMLPLVDADSSTSSLVYTITNSNQTQSGYFTVGDTLLAKDGDDYATFTQADVKAGLVKYHLFGNGPEGGRTDFIEFTVKDGAKTIVFDENGGGYARDGGIYATDTEQSQVLQKFRLEVNVPEDATGGAGEDLPDLPDMATGIDIGTNTTLVIKESGQLSLKDHLKATDTGIDSPTEKIVFRIEKEPEHGTLYRGETALKIHDSFTQAEIDNGNITYEHSGNEVFSDHFHFSVSNGDIVTSSADNQFNFDITPQNDSPVATPSDAVVGEGQAVEIKIELTDPDNDGGHNADGYDKENKVGYRVDSVPAHGDLYLVDANGFDINNFNSLTDVTGLAKVEQGAVFEHNDLQDKRLIYIHNGSENYKDGNDPINFKITPIDDANVGIGSDGTGTGNAQPDATNQSSAGEQATINIVVTPRNDAPIFVDKSEPGYDGKDKIYEGESFVIHGAKSYDGEDGKGDATVSDEKYYLVYEDSDSTSTQRQYRVTEAPEYGKLMLGNTVLSVGSVFSQTDLDAGRIKYEHDGSENHKDGFNYVVSDGDWTSNESSHGTNDTKNAGDGIFAQGSVDYEENSSRYNILIAPTNDAPEIDRTPADAADGNKHIVVDSADPENATKLGKFTITDPDLDDDGAEINDDVKDQFRVTVEFPTDLEPVFGNVDWTNNPDLGDVEFISYENGKLIVEGSKGALQGFLNDLEVKIVNGEDPNEKLPIKVTVDDRIYDAGGNVTGANGGDKNKGDVAFGDGFNTDTIEIEVWASAVNDTPEIKNIPTEVIVNEDGWNDSNNSYNNDGRTKLDLSVNGDNIKVTDKDAFDTDDNTLTLTVETGEIYFDQNHSNKPSGTDITADGIGTNTVTLKGTKDDLEAALNSIYYKAPQDFNGNDKLTIKYDDGKNIGKDNGDDGQEPESFDEKTVDIHILPVNDTPIIGDLKEQGENNTGGEVINNNNKYITLNDEYIFSEDTGNAITFTDPDRDPIKGGIDTDISNYGDGHQYADDDAEYTVTIKANIEGEENGFGTISINNLDSYVEPDDLNIEYNDGEIVITGTYDDIHDLLKHGIVYKPDTEGAEDRNIEFTISVNDNSDGGTEITDDDANVKGLETDPETTKSFYFQRTDKNDAPEFDLKEEGPTFAAHDNVNDRKPVILDPDAEVTDEELDLFSKNGGSWDGATLTLERGELNPDGNGYTPTADANDIFGASGDVTFTGDDVVLKVDSADVVVGEILKNSDGTLEIKFNEDANSDAVNKVLASITYTNTESTNDLNTRYGESASVDIIYSMRDGNSNDKPTDGETNTPELGAGQNQGTGGELTGYGKVTVGINRQVVATDDTAEVNEPEGLDDSGKVSGDLTPGKTNNNSDDKNEDHDPDINDTITVIEITGEEGTKDVDGETTIEGKYGTLVVNPDGSYEYTVHPDNLEVQGLVPGETLDEVFNYKVSDTQTKDGDYDPNTYDNAKLTITINGSNDPVKVEVEDPPTGNSMIDGGDPTKPSNDRTTADHIVFESGLPNGTNYGEDGAEDSIKVEHSFTIDALDGLEELKVGGKTISLSEGNKTLVADDIVGESITTEYGEIKLTSYSKDANGLITIGYEYTLNKTTEHSGNDEVFDEITIKATDRAGEEAGTKDSDEQTIKIKIIDDAPLTEDDSNTVRSGETVTSTPEENVLKNDEPGADGWADGGGVVGVKNSDAQDGELNDLGTGFDIEGEHGTLTLYKDGSYEYTADPDTPDGSTDVFTYTVSDKDGDEETADLTITISGSRLSLDPIGEDGSVTVYEKHLPNGTEPHDDGAIVEGQLPKNSNDYDNTALQDYELVEKANDLKYGTVTIDENGNFTYTLTEDVDHSDGDVTDTFTYTAKDANGNTVTNTVTITIIDDEPIAENDVISLGNKPDISGNAITGDDNGAVADKVGADGATVTGIAKGDRVENPDDVAGNIGGAGVEGAYGTIVINPDGSYDYTRNEVVVDGDATDVFTYTITDSDGDTSTATITIEIGNKVPKDIDIPSQQVDEAGLPDGSSSGDGSNKTTGTITFTPGDGDINDHDIKVTSDPENGDVVIKNIKENGDGTVTIEYEYTLTTPTEGDNTDDKFTVTITDEDGDSVDAEVTINIKNDTPTATPDNNNVVQGQTTTGNVIANDKSGADNWSLEGPVTGVVSENEPDNNADADGWIEGEFGKLKLNPDGSYTYTAKPGVGGDGVEDVFTYTVEDGDGDTTTATLTIHISDNTPPEAVDDTATTEEDVPVSGNLLTNDSDPDNDPLTVTEITVGGKTYPVPEDGSKITVTVPGKGKITVDKNGGYTFTPNPGIIGRVPDISYTISDGNGGEDQAKLVINITPGNPPTHSTTTPPAATDPYSPLNRPSSAGTNFIVDSSVITDPSVFFANVRHDNVPRLPIPLHPIIYVNNEVAHSQNLRELADIRANASPDLVSPQLPSSTSLAADLGQDQNLFVSHAIAAAQQRAAMLDSMVSGRDGRTNLSGDGMLHTPSVSNATRDQSQEARLRAQEAALRQAQQAAQKAAIQQAQQSAERAEQQKSALQEAMRARQEALRAQQEAAEQAAEDANSADNAESTSDDMSFITDEAPQQVASRSFSQQLRAAGTRLPMAKRDGIDI